jgi:ribosomal protein S18 acetylase RimI-like enzyme
MMTPTTFTTTPFERRYRQRLDDLIFRSGKVHTHLDWHELGEWLDAPEGQMRLAWCEDQLVGAVALSQPLDRSVWMRLIVLDDHVAGPEIMQVLWAALDDDLRAAEVRQVSALLTRSWLEPLVNDLGFYYDEDIITLQRSGDRHLPDLADTIVIRPASTGDLDGITGIDHAAFAAPWKLTRAELRQAQRVAASTTVALADERIIGYQISTVYRDGAHLARLAVAPDQQAQGIGKALVVDVLRRFFRRGVYTMTVNTQESNHRSQQLYRRLGFRRNGYDLPVWSIML